jgi:hypothetical protein
MTSPNQFYAYIVIIQNSRNTLILLTRFCLYLVIPGPRRFVRKLANGASENSVLRALVTIHDCVLDAVSSSSTLIRLRTAW